MKTVYACQGSHLALSCPPEHQIRVVRTIFMSHIIKNHRRDLFFVIGFKKITLGALTSPNLLSFLSGADGLHHEKISNQT